MYERARLFNRYSRLAALYSILETGRQPFFGGKDFAIAAHARNDVVMVRVTNKPFWKNNTSPSVSGTPSSVTVTPSIPPAMPSLLSDRACRSPPKTTRTPEPTVRVLAAPCPGRARGVRGLWRRGVQRTWL